MQDLQFQAMVVSEEADGSFKRAIATRQVSQLPPGELLIKVAYSSINYKDALSATGNKGVTRNFPHTPGIDVAGVVAKSEAAGFKEGDQVLVIGYDLGMNTPGGWGQYIRVPAAWAFALPAGLSLEEAMIYGTAGLTAGLSVQKLLQNGLKPEQGEVLVTGATGGVGSLAVAILAKLGFKVMAGTGKASEEGFLKSLGAQGITSREEMNDSSGKPMLKPRWAGVVDTVAGNILVSAIKATKPGGSVTCCGMITAIKFESSIFPFILRGVNLLGVDSVEIPLAQKREVFGLLGGAWKIPQLSTLATQIPLEGVEEAVLKLLQGGIKGRHVVKLPA